MLYDPKWGKPSYLAMLLFCESKPADESYEFLDPRTCACAQFSHSMGMAWDEWWRAAAIEDGMWRKLNFLAHDHPRTFGALAVRLRAEIG